MAAKKTGLGKGLDTLIPREKPAPATKLNINEIEPNRDQPRRYFDEDALNELAESIRQVGVITPLIVQKKEGYYEIVAGERRWRAAKLAGLKELPVVIRDYSEEEAAQVALIENIQREDLNPIEEALAYKRLLQEYGLTQEVMAQKVAKSRTAITNSMRLLKLDERVQNMVVSGELSSGHARAILAIENGEDQQKMAQKVVNLGLSVRQTELMIRNTGTRKPRKKQKAPKKSIFVKDMENKLQDAMGTKVVLNEKGNGSGSIEISYFNEDDLERLYQLLLSGKTF